MKTGNEQRRVERNTAKFAYKFSGKCTLRGVMDGRFKRFDREGKRGSSRVIRVVDECRGAKRWAENASFVQFFESCFGLARNPRNLR